MLQDTWDDITAFGSMAFLTVVIVACYALGKYELAALLFLALALCYAIAFPIKVLFYKQRPNRQGYSSLLERYEAASFPSVHSMRAVSFAIVLSAYVGEIFLAYLAGALAVGVMYTRVKLKKHYVIDVFWGAVFGAIIGGVVMLLHPLPIFQKFWMP